MRRANGRERGGNGMNDGLTAHSTVEMLSMGCRWPPKMGCVCKNGLCMGEPGVEIAQRGCLWRNEVKHGAIRVV